MGELWRTIERDPAPTKTPGVAGSKRSVYPHGALEAITDMANLASATGEEPGSRQIVTKILVGGRQVALMGVKSVRNLSREPDSVSRPLGESSGMMLRRGRRKAKIHNRPSGILRAGRGPDGSPQTAKRIEYRGRSA